MTTKIIKLINFDVLTISISEPEIYYSDHLDTDKNYSKVLNIIQASQLLTLPLRDSKDLKEII